MQHWVFDLDGTLVDSFDYFLKFVKIEFEKNSLEFTDAIGMEGLGTPALTFLAKYLGEPIASSALTRLRQQSLIDSQQIRPFPGILVHLEQLKANGCQIAVWTSRDRQTTDLVLKYSGLAPFMDTVVTACCVKRHKPHPDGMQKILDFFKCAPVNVTMVGDHDVDVQAAKATGVRGLRASWHRHLPKSQCGIADGVVTDVAHLSSWFT